MFWRMAGPAQASPIEAILDKDNFTLEELLDEDDFIQEVRSEQGLKGIMPSQMWPLRHARRSASCAGLDPACAVCLRG